VDNIFIDGEEMMVPGSLAVRMWWSFEWTNLADAQTLQRYSTLI
jgi:hypothetical protein